jgi:prepilin-type N-terminal cleavage/methylation domain-containing protein
MARTRRRSLVLSQRGFTLLEMLIVVAIIGTLGAMAALISPGYIRQQKAEGAVSQALEVIRTARETAISERRNVRIVFTPPDVIQTVRENLPIGGVAQAPTVLRTVQLENRVRFLRPVANDTPDLFATTPAQTGAVAFGPSVTRAFTSEGTLIDSNGDVLNGTVFLAIPNQPNSGRAMSIFGATALLRTWRWDGTKWVE